jgi:6-pyruvoyltetrahydropterin/6-carboxytetrahydropterin synthase
MENNEIMVVKEFSFDAAHYLPKYLGKCRGMHGHTYRLQIGIKGEINPPTGMVVDFSLLKTYINNLVIDELDHKTLNEVQVHAFPHENPTAENMALWVADLLSKHLPEAPVRVVFVRLYETPTSYAEWRSE